MYLGFNKILQNTVYTYTVSLYCFRLEQKLRQFSCMLFAF